MLTRTLTLSIAIASATTAFGTTQDLYEKLWSKRAIILSQDVSTQKPKAACVCMDGGANHGKLGAFAKLFASGACGIPITFDGAGNVADMDACFTFEYIGK
jgi:hypothetical protein